MESSSHIFHKTQEMDWQDDPGIPGFKEKMLFEDKEQKSAVRLWYVPPGFGEDVHHGRPHRHYHKSVIERSYTLYGDFPHWEFSSVDDLEGELVIFRPGLVMDRPTGSLHGLLPEPTSLTGAVLIYWNSGPGTSILEPTYDAESIDVPFEPSAKVELNRFNPARLFMADDVPWQIHPSVPGWKYKPLADASHGSAAVSLVHVPTDWVPEKIELVENGADDASWLFVIHGDLRFVLDDAAGGATEELQLTEGCFLRWQKPWKPYFDQKAASDIGCVTLCVGAPIVGMFV